MKHIKEFRLVESSEPEIKREYYPDGSVESEEWFLDRKLHRVDGPARIWYYPDGSVEHEGWYHMGKQHRVEGPTWIWYRPDGSVESEGWYLDGERHRVDGPARIKYHKDGSVELEEWYHMGKRHRVDGPARIRYHKDGSVEYEGWYLDDTRLTKAKWVERTPGLSQEELVKIGGTDPDPEVRQAAHRNPKFPEDLEGWSINLDDWT